MWCSRRAAQPPDDTRERHICTVLHDHPLPESQLIVGAIPEWEMAEFFAGAAAPIGAPPGCDTAGRLYENGENQPGQPPADKRGNLRYRSRSLSMYKSPTSTRIYLLFVHAC